MTSAQSRPQSADRPSKIRPQAASDRMRAVESERQSLAAILNLVRTGRAETRQDLEREAHLGRAVVADRLATLAGFGLVDESAVGRSLGGRAPRLVRFQADAGRLLVATLERDTIGVGLADLAGRLLIEHYEEIDPGTGADKMLGRLMALFAWLAEQDSRDEPWGIGIGLSPSIHMSGNTAPQRGDGPMQDSGSMLSGLLASRFGAPVWLRSAIQMATVGEVGTVTPERARDFLFVHLGVDITAGIVADGRLVPGAQGAAGQFGHVYAGDGYGAVCGCGNVGCLQTVAGCESIAREGLAGAEAGRTQPLADVLARTGLVTVADIGTAARLGDPFSAELLSRSGRVLGTALATLVNLLNPATILVGGELAQTGDICLAAIREAVYRHSQPQVTRDLLIQSSRMSRSSGLAGAAALVVDALFASPFLEDWITAGSPLSLAPARTGPASAKPAGRRAGRQASG